MQNPEVLGKLANAEVNVAIEFRNRVVGEDLDQIRSFSVSEFVEPLREGIATGEDLNAELSGVICGFIAEADGYFRILGKVKCQFPDGIVVVRALVLCRRHVVLLSVGADIGLRQINQHLMICVV